MMLMAYAFIRITNLEKARNLSKTAKPVCHSFGLRCSAKYALKGQSNALHVANHRRISAAALYLPKSMLGPRRRANPSAAMICANAVSTTHNCWGLTPSVHPFGGGITCSLNISNFGKGAPTDYMIAMPLVTTKTAAGPLHV